MRTVFFLDLDGTCTDHTDRSINAGQCPPREQLAAYKLWVETINAGMEHDLPVPGMKDLSNALYESMHLLYLTNRGDQHRELTEAWLKKNGFPPAPVIMRDPNSWDLGDGEYKAREIKRILAYLPGSVIMCDDDPRGEIQKVCDENGWTFFRAHGKVIKR